MSALDLETKKMIYEAIASLIIALTVAGILFRFFFDGWEDYFRCYYPRGLGSLFSLHPPDGYDRLRGFIYNVIWCGTGIVAYYFIHKVFG